MSMQRFDVVVIGGGVIGSSVAYHLAREGARILIVERRAIAAGASGASAGGVRRLHRDPAELPLAVAAVARWPRLADELEADLGYRQGGGLWLAALGDEASERAARREVDVQHAAGATDVRWLGADDLQSVVPGIAAGFSGGAFAPFDGQADATRTTVAFCRAAQRAGATLLVGDEAVTIAMDADQVVGVALRSGERVATDAVVYAGGWRRGPLVPIPSLPLRSFIHQMTATVPDTRRRIEAVIGVAGQRLSLKQLPDMTYMIGGGWHAGSVGSDGSATVDRDHLEGARRSAAAVVPMAGALAVERIWFGAEAHTPDELPVIGAAPGMRGCFLCIGFSGHGFAISPIVGEAVANLVLGGVVAYDLTHFAAQRFTDAHRSLSSVAAKHSVTAG